MYNASDRARRATGVGSGAASRALARGADGTRASPDVARSGTGMDLTSYMAISDGWRDSGYSTAGTSVFRRSCESDASLWRPACESDEMAVRDEMAISLMRGEGVSAELRSAEGETGAAAGALAVRLLAAFPTTSADRDGS